MRTAHPKPRNARKRLDPNGAKRRSVVPARRPDPSVESGLAQRVEYLHILNAIHQAILRAPSSEAIANLVLDAIPQVLPFQQAGIFVADPRGRELIVLAARVDKTSGLKPQARLPVRAFGTKQSDSNAYVTGKRHVVRDIAGAKFSDELKQALDDAGVRAVVALPLQVGNQTIGMLHLYADETNMPDTDEQDMQIADLLAIALQHARLNEIVATTRERLRALSHRQMELEEKQRRELARDLHDMIGQNLTALNINLYSIGRQLDPVTAANLRNRLEDSSRMVEEIVGRIRNLMTELRPSVLDDFGLAMALRWYAGEFGKRTEIAIEIDAEDIAPRLPLDAETALFRIAQEALTNIAKHAHAKHVRLELQAQATHIELTVADDGAGFDFPTMRQDPTKHGVGLVDMRERAEMMHGRLWVECKIGQGTRVSVRVPR